MKFESQIAQIGTRKDPATGAVSPPIYHSATYQHPGFGMSTGYDYTRTSNPTRTILESEFAELEGGVRGFAFASGMAAIATVLALFRQGDHIVASDDLYGGTYRIISQTFHQFGLEATYVDTSDLEAVQHAIRPTTRALLIETPTNPMMKITDIRAISEVAKANDCLVIVDNTFMTPFCQRPLTLGADIVLHSATKYLNGHNDVLAGLVATDSMELAERLYSVQNAIGAVLGPQDCWLTLRGMKTLALRFERQQANARAIADWLTTHPRVTKVYYPGLQSHPGHVLHTKQSSGPGAMLSFTVGSPRCAQTLLASIKLLMFAESLGGLESMVTYPARQTHADVPLDVRERLGITDTLLRMSVGIEHIEDIISDLDQALRA